MNLSNVLHSMLRRWYLVLAGLIATFALCLGAFTTIDPSYERSASEILIPGSLSVTAGDNPYLYLSGLTQAGDVLVRALQAQDVQQAVVQSSPGTSVTVARDTSTSGPIIVITASGQTQAGVASALTRMIDAVPVTLTALQDKAKVAAAARITVIPLTVDTTSTVVQKSRMEAVAVAGAGGLVVTLLLTGLIDGLLLARTRRRTAKIRIPHSRAGAEPQTGYDDEEFALARTAVHGAIRRPQTVSDNR